MEKIEISNYIKIPKALANLHKKTIQKKLNFFNPVYLENARLLDIFSSQIKSLKKEYEKTNDQNLLEKIQGIRKRFHSVRYSIENMPQEDIRLKLYKNLSKEVLLPTGTIHWISKLYKNTKVFDKRIKKSIILKNSNLPELWEHQKNAKIELTKYFNKKIPFGCCIQMPTGSGKTLFAIDQINELKCTTLILVETLGLQDQWRLNIKKFLNYDVGLIGNGNHEIKDITVGITDSIFKIKHELKDRFSFVICDEVHHLAINQYSSIINNLNATYKLGLSATIFRKDQLTDVIYQTIGKVVFSIKTNDLIKKGIIYKPTYNVINGQEYEGLNENYTKLLSIICSDKARNKKIVKKAIEKANQGRKVLVISDRIKHLQELYSLAKKHSKLNIELATGSESSGNRDEIIEKATNCKVDILFVSTILDEGIDVPILDTLIFATPFRARNRVIQRIGRICRKHKDKKDAEIWDIKDKNKTLGFQFQARKQVYNLEFDNNENNSLGIINMKDKKKL